MQRNFRVLQITNLFQGIQPYQHKLELEGPKVLVTFNRKV
jgi:hypothetical protein